MDFSFSDEQVMIRDSAETFLAETCDSEAVRAAMQRDEGYDPSVWTSIAQELGWCGLPVAEELGGLGLGPVELVLVQEQAGYRLLPSPFFSSVCLGATLLNEAADRETQEGYLPALAAGELLLSGPLGSTIEGWAQTSLRAEQSDGAWVLHGDIPRVPDASSAQLLLVTADTSDGLGLFRFVPDAAQIEALPGWDSGRRFARLSLNAQAAVRCDGERLVEGLRLAATLLRLYIAAEQLGAAQRCLDLTLDYVQERKQFGRIIGSFQAVKHRCAEMMVAVENTRSQVYGAAALAASQVELPELEMEVAAARALATQSLQYCAGEAIQLHGGVGFTWEYDPQLYFKRAQASAHWLGSPSALRGLIAAQLLE